MEPALRRAARPSLPPRRPGRGRNHNAAANPGHPATRTPPDFRAPRNAPRGQMAIGVKGPFTPLPGGTPGRIKPVPG
jgi:hypothetical protein